MNSIRIFLVIVLVATITLVNFVTALHGYRQGMQESQNVFAAKLVQQAQILNSFPDIQQAIGTAHSGNPVVIQSLDAKKTLLADISFQIFDGDGNLLLRSDNAPVTAMTEFRQGFTLTNFSGYRWGSQVLFNPEKNIWVMVADRDDLRHQLSESIILESIFPVVAVLPLIAVMVWFIVSIGLKPIRNLASQLRTRSAANLSPVELDAVPRELIQLATSTNDLLQRLEASFRREKRFNSDVAHELRTPIAAMKIHMQNLIDEDQTLPDSALKLKQGIERMNSLVEQMLILNRMTPDHYVTQFTNVNLFEVIKKVIAEDLEQVNSKRQKLEFEGDPGTVYGDFFAIEMLIKNILDNAIKYTPESGRILIRLRNTTDELVLQIMDSGPGIPEDQYDNVFERFYRVDGDRHDSAVTGSGLGLSIVKYIIDLHQARIRLGPSEFETGLCVTMGFPVKVAR